MITNEHPELVRPVRDIRAGYEGKSSDGLTIDSARMALDRGPDLSIDTLVVPTMSHEPTASRVPLRAEARIPCREGSCD